MKKLASNEMNTVSGGCCGLIAAGTVAAAVVLGVHVLKPALEGVFPGNAISYITGKISGIFNIVGVKTTTLLRLFILYPGPFILVFI